jgi:hypothetical protein
MTGKAVYKYEDRRIEHEKVHARGFLLEGIA